MRKIIINTIILAVLLLPNSLIAQTNDEKCENLKKEIQILVDDCKTCKTDEECFVDEGVFLGCPFGCYFIRSHVCDDGEYLALIEEKNEQQDVNGCPICVYSCPVPPEKHEIGCRQGKCVDLRFYSEKNN